MWSASIVVLKVLHLARCRAVYALPPVSQRGGEEERRRGGDEGATAAHSGPSAINRAEIRWPAVYIVNTPAASHTDDCIHIAQPHSTGRDNGEQRVCTWCLSYRRQNLIIYIFILRRMGKYKAQAHHTSTYFYRRLVRVDLTQLHSLSIQLVCWRILRFPR